MKYVFTKNKKNKKQKCWSKSIFCGSEQFICAITKVEVGIVLLKSEILEGCESLESFGEGNIVRFNWL